MHQVVVRALDEDTRSEPPSSFLYRYLDDRNQQLTLRLQDLTMQLGLARGEVSSIQTERDRLHAELQAERQARTTAEQQVAGLQGLLQGADAERARLEQQVTQLQQQVQDNSTVWRNVADASRDAIREIRERQEREQST